MQDKQSATLAKKLQDEIDDDDENITPLDPKAPVAEKIASNQFLKETIAACLKPLQRKKMKQIQERKDKKARDIKAKIRHDRYELEKRKAAAEEAKVHAQSVLPPATFTSKDREELKKQMEHWQKTASWEEDR